MTSMRAAIYARYSSDKQSERSIDDQIALCRAFCERDGLNVVAVYDDRATSGASTANRFGWLQLMRDARAGRFDVVVAEALDRISRDQEDLAGIHKRLRFLRIEIRTVQDGKTEEIHVGVKGLLGALYLKDLAQKTKRGQAGVIRDRRHCGGRSYGYRSVKGQAGRLEIDEAEAEVVRRIFAAYAAGQPPRALAATLNREGIPGPRGGPWNASTIGGSRKRRNGILQNELYVGRIVWNRQSFIKDPETGRRISRLNARSEWLIADVPELRIVDNEIWARVQRRRSERGSDRRYMTKPRHLLSGLLRCGCCGSGYIVSGRDKRGAFLRCSRMIETGLCENRRTVGLASIEARVLEGIEKHLAAPDLIAEYVREFHRAWRRLRDTAAQRRGELRKQLAGVEADIEKAVDLLLKGTASRALKERLAELEARREELERAIAEVAPPPVELHPNAAESYRKRVRDLKAAIQAADPDNRAEAIRGIRELVEKIVIHPSGPYRSVDIEIHGRLAALLRASEAGTESAPRSVGMMVAGVGFEPTTFRL